MTRHRFATVPSAHLRWAWCTYPRQVKGGRRKGGLALDARKASRKTTRGSFIGRRGVYVLIAHVFFAFSEHRCIDCNEQGLPHWLENRFEYANKISHLLLASKIRKKTQTIERARRKELDGREGSSGSSSTKGAEGMERCQERGRRVQKNEKRSVKSEEEQPKILRNETEDGTLQPLFSAC